MNALAALVSYLPAADPSLYCIKEGNAALPAALLSAAAAGGWAHLRAGEGVASVARGDDGRFTLNTTAGVCAVRAAACGADYHSACHTRGTHTYRHMHMHTNMHVHPCALIRSRRVI